MHCTIPPYAVHCRVRVRVRVRVTVRVRGRGRGMVTVMVTVTVTVRGRDLLPHTHACKAGFQACGLMRVAGT